MHRFRTAFAPALSIALFALVAGCKVTPEDINHWKRTVKGPGKLVAVLRSDHYEVPLRTQAALALVEMERSDVDGVTELNRAIERMEATHDPALPAIIESLAPELERAMNAQVQAGQSPVDDSVRAKDAAYMLLRRGNATTRARLTQAVVAWYVQDFTGRSLAGNYSVEQVCRELGAPAASQLVNALNSHLSKDALLKIAELVGQLGDAPTKAAAAARLVAIEREMEGDGFLNWLKSEIKKQLVAAGQANPPDTRVTAAALVNRDNFVNDGALPAMKHLGGENVIRERLLEIANTRVAADSPDAEVMNTRRQRALQALEGHATPADLPRILPIALDATNPPNVRDYAFDRINDTHSRDAIAPMWPLVSADASAGTDEEKTLARRLRWRAGELVLAIGGSGVIPEFLAKLPSGDAVVFEPSELEGYATRISQMGDAPMGLMRQQLSSPSWSRQVIGIHFFARRGAHSDMAALERLKSSNTPCVGPGWTQHDPPLGTVGKVAATGVATLTQRLANPQPTTGR